MDYALAPALKRLCGALGPSGDIAAAPIVRGRRSGRPPRLTHGRRVLAMCLGGIGDTVLAFAALRDLRRACPDDHITALAMWPQSAELLEDLGLFDVVRCHNFQKEGTWKSLMETWRLRRERYDASLIAFPANRFEYNVVARLIGARRRWGHGYLRGGDWSNLRFLLTDRVEQQLGRHVVDENRALVAAFAGVSSEQPADTRLGPIAPVYHSHAARMLAHLQDPLVGIHAGSSLYKGLGAKRWPAERFGQLCHRMRHELGAQPVLFGLPNEIDLKLAIQAVCPDAFFAHGDSIRQTAALIGRCAAFVSNDSSLAHIANALDVPVVMLCGPTDAREVGPYGVRQRAVVSAEPCAPCFRVGRKPLHCTHAVHQACMQRITVEDVLGVLNCSLAPRLAPGRVLNNAKRKFANVTLATGRRGESANVNV